MINEKAKVGDALAEWENRPWGTLYYCAKCYANRVTNDSGTMQSHELCEDGSEDHDWEIEMHRPEPTS